MKNLNVSDQVQVQSNSQGCGIKEAISSWWKETFTCCCNTVTQEIEHEVDIVIENLPLISSDAKHKLIVITNHQLEQLAAHMIQKVQNPNTELQLINSNQVTNLANTQSIGGNLQEIPKLVNNTIGQQKFFISKKLEIQVNNDVNSLQQEKSEHLNEMIFDPEVLGNINQQDI